MGKVSSQINSCGRWLFQTRPLNYPNERHAILCFVFLSIFSLLAQAIRWAIPTLQASGLQCASCGDQNDANYHSCTDQCLPLSDVEMGVLSGPAFTISMTLASLPLGWFADRTSRVRLIWILSLAWSVGSLAAGVSDGFWQLLFACVLIGCAASCINPCAFSLLADYFSTRRRSLVISAFSAVIFIGYDAGLVTGIISQYLSWRWAFTLLGIPGFIVFFPALLMREPARGLSEQNNDDDEFTIQPLTEDFDSRFDFMEEEEDIEPVGDFQSSNSLRRDLTVIFSSAPFLSIWISATLRLLGGFALGAWIPSFYRRVFGLDPWEISLYLTLALTIGGLSGSYVGGFIADFWSQKSRAGKVWLVLTSTLLSLPFIFGTLLLPNVFASLICLIVASFFGEMWFGSSAAAVQDMIDPSTRSLATSIYLLGIGIGGISPVIVGYLNQQFAIKAPHGTLSETAYDPTYSMLIVISLMYSLCAIGYAITGYIIKRQQRGKLDEGFSPSDALRHTINLDDTAWGDQ